MAIENGDLDMVRLLLEYGADAHASDFTGETPLMQRLAAGCRASCKHCSSMALKWTGVNRTMGRRR